MCPERLASLVCGGPHCSFMPARNLPDSSRKCSARNLGIGMWSKLHDQTGLRRSRLIVIEFSTQARQHARRRARDWQSPRRPGLRAGTLERSDFICCRFQLQVTLKCVGVRRPVSVAAQANSVGVRETARMPCILQRLPQRRLYGLREEEIPNTNETPSGGCSLHR